jgi:hypothetical protein
LVKKGVNHQYRLDFRTSFRWCTVRSSGELSMRGVCVRSFPVVLVALLMGCSPEGKAKRALETYETVFRSCKEETEKAKMQPGEHQCSSIASSALDLGLDQTQLQEPKRSEMLTAWLEKKKFVGYYVPRDKRPAEK